MIPETNGLIESEENFLEEPSSKTYLIDFDKKCLCISSDEGDDKGFIDELKAMEQAVYCILNTERYEYVIYSWDYGSELQDVIGMDTDIVLSEIERRVTEALMADSRILSVDNFNFETNKREVTCTFSVLTIYGDLEMKQEVEI